jgi:hypothetical protein
MPTEEPAMSPTTPKTAVGLFVEYKRDEEAALNPCTHCLIEKCPEDEREKLFALLEAWTEDEGYRSPPYSPVQLRRIQAKLQPIDEQVHNDPAVIAAEDQIAAAWRDKPWWRKRISRAKFSLFAWRMRLSIIGRKKPWE